MKNQIIFAGEYFNDKRWNGIIYDINNNFSFELNQGYGKGVEFGFDGKILFIGEYQNGKRCNGKYFNSF